jgi:hypothetical protein
MNAPLFTFNGDYHDLEQVAPWLDEFSRIRDEIISAGRYTYNDDFRDKIPGIANKEYRGPSSGTHEDTAIYLLQGLYRKRENAARIEAALRDGCEPIASIERITKFSRVIVYDDQNRMRGPIWQEWESARLIPETNPNHNPGEICAVLPKGKRSSGYRVNGRKVLVKR